MNYAKYTFRYVDEATGGPLIVITRSLVFEAAIRNVALY